MAVELEEDISGESVFDDADLVLSLGLGKFLLVGALEEGPKLSKLWNSRNFLRINILVKDKKPKSLNKITGNP